jgi:hypothetical protein
MKLSTIWTVPAMSLKERLHRTSEWALLTVAQHLPKRLQYWTLIAVGAKVTTSTLADTPVPEVLFMDVLEHAEGGPRA